MIVPLDDIYFQISAVVCGMQRSGLRVSGNHVVGSGTGCDTGHADELSTIKLRHASPPSIFQG